MSSGTNEIGLLAQRLEAQEKINAKQAAQIEIMQASLSEMRGAATHEKDAKNDKGKWIGPLAGIGFAMVTGFFGNSIFAEQKELKAEIREAVDGVVKVELSAADREARVKVLEGKKSIDTSRLEEDVVFVKSAIVRLDGDMARKRERLDAVELNVGNLKSEMAAVRTSTSTALTEVETQIRGVVDIENSDRANVRQLIGTMWPKVFGSDLQENDFFPANIPAKAIVEIGKVGQ